MIAILQSISETKPFGIQQIFLVTTIDPGFNNPTQAHTKFLATLNQKKAEITATHIRIKILSFKVVFSSPTTYLLTHNMCISTKHTRLRSSNPNRHRWCKFWRVFPAITSASLFQTQCATNIRRDLKKQSNTKLGKLQITAHLYSKTSQRVGDVLSRRTYQSNPRSQGPQACK